MVISPPGSNSVDHRTDLCTSYKCFWIWHISHSLVYQWWGPEGKQWRWGGARLEGWGQVYGFVGGRWTVSWFSCLKNRQLFLLLEEWTVSCFYYKTNYLAYGSRQCSVSSIINRLPVMILPAVLTYLFYFNLSWRLVVRSSKNTGFFLTVIRIVKECVTVWLITMWQLLPWLVGATQVLLGLASLTVN